MALCSSNVSCSQSGLVTEKSETYKKCRICLEFDHENKLIYPCNCIGSMKYVHEV